MPLRPAALAYCDFSRPCAACHGVDACCFRLARALPGARYRFTPLTSQRALACVGIVMEFDAHLELFFFFILFFFFSFFFFFRFFAFFVFFFFFFFFFCGHASVFSHQTSEHSSRA